MSDADETEFFEICGPIRHYEMCKKKGTQLYGWETEQAAVFNIECKRLERWLPYYCDRCDLWHIKELDIKKG